MSRITICSPDRDTLISDALFGCNMEITRRTGWGGLYAQMLNNRKFFAVSGQAQCGWKLSGAARLTDAHGESICKSHCIDLESGGTVSSAGDFLAMSRGKEYLVAVYVQGKGTFSCSADGSEKKAFKTDFRVDSALPVRLEKAVCAAVALWRGVFRFHVAEGRIRLHTVSLLPADHFHQMRRDVADCLKRLRPAAFRFPGGCLADHYSWKDGLLPVDCRPPIDGREKDFLLPDSYHQDAFEIGIDEFMELCRYVGAQPELTVRLVNGPIQDAADLVEYCNGSAGTPWGALRESRGYPAFQVTDWYVGNEIYAFGHELADDGRAAARVTNACIQAMRQIDPSIRTAAASLSLRPDWNGVYLAETSAQADLYSYHFYLATQFDPWWKKVSEGMMMNAVDEGLLPELKNTWQQAQALGGGRQHGISFDEWNYSWGIPGNMEMMVCDSLIWNFLCADSADFGVEKALFFHPVNEGLIRVSAQTAGLDTAGEAMLLFQPHRGGHRLSCRMKKAPKSPSAAASRTPRGIYVTVVNRDAHHSREILLESAFWKAKDRARAVMLIPDRLAFSCSTMRRRTVTLSAAENGFRLVLPPAAAAGITILPHGAADKNGADE